jgi:NitT/TauT family transport system substrate-binding protein
MTSVKEKREDAMFTRCAAALLLAGLGAPAYAQVQAQEQTVTVQLVRSIAQAPYYIAVDKGYFAQEGIKLQSGIVRSALDTIAPMASGELDVGIGAATAGFFNAAHQGFDLRVVAAMGVQGPVMATQPLIRQALWDGGTIRSAKNFPGHRIAINAPGDITEYFLTLMARKYHLDFKALNVVPLGFAEQFVALKNGAIDAGFLPEPLSTTARMAGVAALDTADDGVGAGAVPTNVFFGTEFMQQQPKAAFGFLRALVRGAHDAQGSYLKDPAIAASIAKQTDLKVAAIENATPYAIDPNLDIAKFEGQLRDQEAVHREHGELNYQGRLSFANVIDASLVHQAAAGLK